MEESQQTTAGFQIVIYNSFYILQNHHSSFRDDKQIHSSPVL